MGMSWWGGTKDEGAGYGRKGQQLEGRHTGQRIQGRWFHCGIIAFCMVLPQLTSTDSQKIQNYAARITMLTPKRSHISRVLTQLHWLPVRQRIGYKILLYTYKALNRLAPAYLLRTTYAESGDLEQCINTIYTLHGHPTRLGGWSRNFSCLHATNWNCGKAPWC